MSTATPSTPSANPGDTSLAEPAPGTPPSSDAPTPLPALRTLQLRDPFVWLLLGWRDFIRAPGIGLFYGACFTAMGWALMKVFEHAPAYTLALCAGFLLMGPLLCLGLYHASHELEAGRQPDFGQSLLAWDSHVGPLAIFGFVLLVLEMLWSRASLIIFAVSFDGMPDFKGSLMALLNPGNLEFIMAYLGVGAVFAGLIFSVCVIAMPMLLDRDTDAITAGLTSMRLVLTQPGVMLLWGALLSVLVVLALLPWFLGLLLVGPVTGHATWHAYRAAVAPVDAAVTPDAAG